MDQRKLESIVEAIIAEAKQPQPSHANLARLVAMALQELIATQAIIASHETDTASTTANGVTEFVQGD